jgi:hypothetical protein
MSVMIPGTAIVPVARVVSPQPVVILGTAEPFEPGRRVTPGRQDAGPDLASDQGHRFARSTYRRGRLVDLFI